MVAVTDADGKERQYLSSGPSVTTDGSITQYVPLVDTRDPKLIQFQMLFEIDDEIEDRIPEDAPDREKLLAAERLKDFKARYSSYTRAIVFKDFVSNLCSASLRPLIATTATQFAMTNLGYERSLATMTSMSFGLLAMVAQSTNELIKSAQKVASTEAYIRHDFLDWLHHKLVSKTNIFMRVLYTPTKPVVNVLMERYITQKPYLPSKLRDKIEKGLWTLDSEPDKGGKQDTNSWDQSLNYLVNFPKHSRECTFDDAKFEILFSGYDDRVKDLFRRVGKTHAKRSKYQNSGLSPYPRKQIILLWGNHGVGKTRAMGTLAEVLGASLSIIDLEKSKGQSLSTEEIFGDGKWPIDNVGVFPKAFSDPTGFTMPIAAGLSSKKDIKCRNPIILFDEADKPEIPNSTLIKLLEPSTQEMDAGIFKDLDVSHALYVLNMNTDPSTFSPDTQRGIHFLPLLSRAEVIHMPDLTKEQKSHNIFEESVPEYLASKKKEIPSLTDRQMDLLRKKVDSLRSKLEGLIAEDTAPGMRDLHKAFDPLLDRECEELTDSFIVENARTAAAAGRIVRSEGSRKLVATDESSCCRGCFSPRKRKGPTATSHPQSIKPASAPGFDDSEVTVTVAGEETESLLRSRRSGAPISNKEDHTDTKDD